MSKATKKIEKNNEGTVKSDETRGWQLWCKSLTRMARFRLVPSFRPSSGVGAWNDLKRREYIQISETVSFLSIIITPLWYILLFWANVYVLKSRQRNKKGIIKIRFKKNKNKKRLCDIDNLTLHRTYWSKGKLSTDSRDSSWEVPQHS